MRKLILAAGLAASLGAMGAANVASAYPYYYSHHHRYYGDYHHRYYGEYHHRYYGDYRHTGGCRYQTHRNGAIGAVAGAIGGGIIGSSITHGRAGGTLLGAGAGALTGNAIGRNTTRC
jgi:outer membrane lipoprotein SlyB